MDLSSRATRVLFALGGDVLLRGQLGAVPASAERLDQQYAGSEPAGEDFDRRPFGRQRGGLRLNYGEVTRGAGTVLGGGYGERPFGGIDRLVDGLALFPEDAQGDRKS